MKIEFEKMEMQVKKNFNGGEKEFLTKMLVDSNNKIMKGNLVKGASIGMHVHDTSSEIMFILKGVATYTVIDKDGNMHKEVLKEGECHYLKMGESHSLINLYDEDLEFYGVVPNHK